MLLCSVAHQADAFARRFPNSAAPQRCAPLYICTLKWTACWVLMCMFAAVVLICAGRFSQRKPPRRSTCFHSFISSCQALTEI